MKSCGRDGLGTAAGVADERRRRGGPDSPKISCFQEETCVARMLLKDLPKMQPFPFRYNVTAVVSLG